MRDRTADAELRSDVAGDVSKPLDHELVGITKPVLGHIGNRQRLSARRIAGAHADGVVM